METMFVLEKLGENSNCKLSIRDIWYNVESDQSECKIAWQFTFILAVTFKSLTQDTDGLCTIRSSIQRYALKNWVTNYFNYWASPIIKLACKGLSLINLIYSRIRETKSDFCSANLLNICTLQFTLKILLTYLKSLLILNLMKSS